MRERERERDRETERQRETETERQREKERVGVLSEREGEINNKNTIVTLAKFSGGSTNKRG